VSDPVLIRLAACLRDVGDGTVRTGAYGGDVLGRHERVVEVRSPATPRPTRMGLAPVKLLDELGWPRLAGCGISGGDLAHQLVDRAGPQSLQRPGCQSGRDDDAVLGHE